MEGEGDVELQNCATCGRNFRPDVLRKHVPICIKNSKKKRKIFDSGKQRAEGSDIPINKVLKPGEVPKRDPKAAIAEARTKQWREKHESLVEAFRAAREYAKAKERGGPLPPPPPAVVDPSLVQCPYCQRRFNEEASKRHIPFCKDQQARAGPRTAPQAQRAPQPRTAAPRLPAANGGLPRATRASPQTSQYANSRMAEPSSLRPRAPTKAPPAPGPARPRPVASSTPAAVPPGSRGSSGAAPARTVGRPGPQATRGTPLQAPSRQGPARKAATSGGTFCHECGAAFPVAGARFCSECGVRRLAL